MREESGKARLLVEERGKNKNEGTHVPRHLTKACESVCFSSPSCFCECRVLVSWYIVPFLVFFLNHVCACFCLR
jgi:hypothetical protein